jgi:glycosyltransferase involved in cell wall biosynthesis
MIKPDVSVILPTYNQFQYLELAIKSVLSQSFKNWELIIIDNNSDDGTSKILNKYKSNKIKILKINNHGIIAKSRNKGIIESNGKYIAFLDSDDIWYPNKLEKCLELLKPPYSLICHSELWNYDGNKKTKHNYGPNNKSLFINLLFKGNCLSTSAILVLKKEIIKAKMFSEDYRFNTVEDYHLWLKLSKNGVKMNFINNVLGEYLIHSANNSNAVKRNFNAHLAVFDDIYSKINERSSYYKILYNKRLAEIIYLKARSLSSNGIKLKAIKNLFLAIFKWPFKLKYYYFLFVFLIK